MEVMEHQVHLEQEVLVEYLEEQQLDQVVIQTILPMEEEVVVAELVV
jgi:hypothetical protein